MEEQGTIQRASAAELSKRKIVRVKRTAEAADGTSKNPFAGVSLGGAEQKDDTTNGAAVGKGGDTQRVEKRDKEATGTTERKEDKETTAKVVGGGTSDGGFGGLASSTGGFGGLASSTGGFGGLASSTGGLAFGAQKRDGSETGTAVFGGDTKKHENNNDAGKVSITGEEEEKTVFSRDASLFELHEGTWKERGQGIVKVNTQEETRRARIIMRQKGNLKLILNANVWEKMEPKRMEGGTVCIFMLSGFVVSSLYIFTCLLFLLLTHYTIIFLRELHFCASTTCLLKMKNKGNKTHSHPSSLPPLLENYNQACLQFV